MIKVIKYQVPSDKVNFKTTGKIQQDTKVCVDTNLIEYIAMVNMIKFYVKCGIKFVNRSTFRDSFLIWIQNLIINFYKISILPFH